MNALPQSLRDLIEALTCLPGVGQKSAQRMAFFLLERNRNGGEVLSKNLAHAMAAIGHCEQCNTFADQALCPVCESPRRDGRRICVVESCADVLAIEEAAQYDGRYFVLHGRLSPLDGLGPEELRMPRLHQQLQDGQVDELIIATNGTVEGQATAHYLAEMARLCGTTASRIAHGVPMGGELEYIDSRTLSHAFGERQILK